MTGGVIPGVKQALRPAYPLVRHFECKLGGAVTRGSTFSGSTLWYRAHSFWNPPSSTQSCPETQPIRNEPPGTTTISGQSSQARNTCPGVQAASCGGASGAMLAAYSIRDSGGSTPATNDEGTRGASALTAGGLAGTLPPVMLRHGWLEAAEQVRALRAPSPSWRRLPAPHAP